MVLRNPLESADASVGGVHEAPGTRSGEESSVNPGGALRAQMHNPKKR